MLTATCNRYDKSVFELLSKFYDNLVRVARKLNQWVLKKNHPYCIVKRAIYDSKSQRIGKQLTKVNIICSQVILPALLEQSHTRTWLKAGVRAWCACAAGVLGLRSYLLGEMRHDQPMPHPPRPPHQLGAAHQVYYIAYQKIYKQNNSFENILFELGPKYCISTTTYLLHP